MLIETEEACSTSNPALSSRAVAALTTPQLDAKPQTEAVRKSVGLASNSDRPPTDSGEACAKILDGIVILRSSPSVNRRFKCIPDVRRVSS